MPKFAGPLEHTTALVALLKTNGGQDKVFKLIINYCKLLLVYQIAAAKGSAEKTQKALAACRSMMRLGQWIDGVKKLSTMGKPKMTLPAILELFSTIFGTLYKIEDNLKWMSGQGLVTIDKTRNQNSAKFNQFWQYVFGALVAWFGKDGYLESVAKAKKAKAEGDTEALTKAKAKATKALLKVTHHSLDTLGNLQGMNYIPAFKPPASFSPICGLGSAAITTYLQYNDQLDKVLK